MNYRRLGNYGIRVSEVSLGAWLTFGGSVDADKSKQIIHKALEQKVNFFDTADVYSGGAAEKVVGDALAEEQFTRKDLVISSKVFWPTGEQPNNVGLSRKHIMDSIVETLDRLKMDYLDIYFCHRFDWQTPIRETIETMDDLVREGLIRYWGTSMWSAANIERGIAVAKEIGARLPAVEQARYNMLDRHIELEVMESTTYHGMGITPYSPLDHGILTGKYNDGIPDGSRAAAKEFVKNQITPDVITKVKALQPIADELEVTMSQLALAWILRRPEISSVITGASKPEHVESNLPASGLTLSLDVLERIEKILDNAPTYYGAYAPAMTTR